MQNVMVKYFQVTWKMNGQVFSRKSSIFKKSHFFSRKVSVFQKVKIFWSFFLKKSQIFSRKVKYFQETCKKYGHLFSKRSSIFKKSQLFSRKPKMSNVNSIHFPCFWKNVGKISIFWEILKISTSPSRKMTTDRFFF